jgi:hypothetical protein
MPAINYSPACYYLLIILILLVLALAFFPKSLLIFPPSYDEVHHHYPAFQQFQSSFPSLPLANYSAATAPLPVIISALVDSIIPLNLAGLRALCLFCWLLAVCLLWFFSSRLKLSNHMVPFIWLISPYILSSAFTFNSIAFTLPLMALFMLGGLCFIDGKTSGFVLLISSLVLIGWVRQSELYLLIPALYLILTEPKIPKWKLLPWLLLPPLAFLPLFLLWENWVPPDYTLGYGARLQLEPAQLTLSLCIIGLLTAPFVWNMFRRPAQAILMGSAAVVWVFLFPIPIENNHGIIIRGLQWLGGLYMPLSIVGQIVLAGFGAMNLIKVFRKDRAGVFLYVCLFSGMIALLLVGNVWERLHYSLLLPLYLLVARVDDLRLIQVIIMLVLTLALSIAMVLRITSGTPDLFF